MSIACVYMMGRLQTLVVFAWCCCTVVRVRLIRWRVIIQSGGIDCGLYLLNNAAAIFRRFDQLSALSNSENLGQNWFPPFSTLQMRQMFANLIRKLSAEQDIGVTSWPDLNLN